MTGLVAVPMAVPLAAMALTILAGRSRSAQRVISLATLAAMALVTVALLVHVDGSGPLAAVAGGWPAPIGISLVVDRFAAIMLVIAQVMLLAVLVYAIGQGGVEERHVGFHPVYLALAAGVSGAFVAGDLFNLFVCFEVMLTASFVLLTLGGRSDQVRTGMTYVVISLLASVLFLAAVSFFYAATGTVNMADLSVKLATLDPGLRQALILLLLVVFGVKAAVFPLFFWLPDSYPTAPTAVTAVLAGLLTKVGVYAIVRTQTLLADPAERPAALLAAVAGATMLVGVLGAIAQNDMKRILSFQVVSQIGYVVMGLGFFTAAGLAGAILYIVHSIIVKTTLFLTSGLVEHRSGTGHLDQVSGLVRSAPVLGVLFLLPALSLAGVPPLSGFVAKLALVDAGMARASYAVVGISLLVSLLALFSMTRIWAGAFWGEVAPVGRPQRALPALMLVPTAALTAASVAVALAAGPLFGLSTRAAEELLSRRAYVEAVLDR
ncbi:MAG: proton-conducting transporter membrane subunit [Acidimicrobiales bacterium]